MPHVPALDQLRCVEVPVVVAFLMAYLDGGYLGGSTFFALSGFLITPLLVNEFEATGSGGAGRVGHPAVGARVIDAA